MQITTKSCPFSQHFTISFDEVCTGTFLLQDIKTVSWLFPLCVNTVRRMALLSPQIDYYSVVPCWYCVLYAPGFALFSKCVLECVVPPPPYPPHPPHPPLAYVEALYPGMLLSVTTCTWRSLPAIHARHISHHLSQLDLSGSYFAGLSLSILHVFFDWYI